MVSKMPETKFDESHDELESKSLSESYVELAKDIGVITPGKTLLLYGDSIVYRASLFMVEELLKRTDSVALIDGANRFDLYTLARLAQIDGFAPPEILDRIYLSRVFTGYQMDAVLTNGVAPFLALIRSRVVFVFGLLHTLFDDQVPVREAQKSLLRIRSRFENMKQNGISIVLASENLIPRQPERKSLIKCMLDMADKLYVLDGNAAYPAERRVTSSHSGRQAIARKASMRI